jgi:hypothetical protein
MRPEISVVIPVHARQESGEHALRSAMSQSGVGLEVIIVDDGSPTPFRLPPDLADDSHIRLVRQPNGGPAAARNRGVAEARGEWIAFLDSDDLWLPEKLSRQLAHARAGIAGGWPALTAVMCGFTQVEIATGQRRARIPMESWSPADLAAGCWFGPGSTALIPRTAFDAIGPFDASLRRLEDLDWFLRLALAGGGVATWPELAVQVNVGGRPSVPVLDGAVDLLKQKWLTGRLLDPACRRNLQAYLALEQASARRHAGQWPGFARYMIRSLMLRPRTSIPLRDWWPDRRPGAQ